MKTLIKIMLFPIALVLTIIISIGRFLCCFSSTALNIISSIIFIIAVLALLMLKDSKAALNAFIIAFVLSPYGIVAIVNWLLGRLEALAYSIKSI